MKKTLLLFTLCTAMACSWGDENTTNYRLCSGNDYIIGTEECAMCAMVDPNSGACMQIVCGDNIPPAMREKDSCAICNLSDTDDSRDDCYEQIFPPMSQNNGT